MQLSQILKRLIPFVGAIIIGVFVAGIFFSVSGTGTGSSSIESLQRDNARLRAENCRLKRKLRERHHMRYMLQHELNVPEPPLAPAPPVPPMPPSPPAAPEAPAK